MAKTAWKSLIDGVEILQFYYYYFNYSSSWSSQFFMGFSSSWNPSINFIFRLISDQFIPFLGEF